MFFFLLAISATWEFLSMHAQSNAEANNNNKNNNNKKEVGCVCILGGWEGRGKMK